MSSSVASSDVICLQTTLQNQFSTLSSENAKFTQDIEKLKCQSDERSAIFHQNLIKFTTSLFNNPEYSNIVFRTADEDLYGHRFILDAREAKWIENREDNFCIVNVAGKPSVHNFIP